jgi:serine/threonine-protein kinase
VGATPTSKRRARAGWPALVACLSLACGVARAEAPPRFPDGATWHQDISRAPAHPSSASMIATLAGLGGFGNGRMQIDFSMHVVRAAPGAPTRTITGYPDDPSYYAPDCAPIGTAMPVPANAAIEGNTGLSCSNASADCHLLVVQGDTLYEAYRANAGAGATLQAQCLAVWRLGFVYPDDNRGEHCTSADAAGMPIAPLLFNADEVQAAIAFPEADLGHAIRFILPNARMASNGGTRYYVHPASHAGAPSGPVGSVPHGSRLRLRGDFPVHLYPPAARVILRTMQRYGIVLADGGNIALTAESDRFTVHTWAELGIDSRTFDLAVPAAPVKVQDFEVLDTGARIVESYDCQRNPPILAVRDSVAPEGNAPGVRNVQVELSEPVAAPVGFDVFTRAGTASASDYTDTAAIGLSIAAGNTGLGIPVAVLGDTVPEADETFVVEVANPVGASLGDGQGRVVLANDDLPELRIGDASVTEGNAGQVTIAFPVTLSRAVAAPVTFEVSTANGSAQAGLDYVARAQARLMDPGRTRTWFEVQVTGDATVEPDEWLAAQLANVVGAVIADGSATGTIVNDDGAALRKRVARKK